MTREEILQLYADGERSFPAAQLRNTNLRDADLQDADLEGADLRGANLENTSLKNTNLQNAIFLNANLKEEGAEAMLYYSHAGDRSLKQNAYTCRALPYRMPN